MTFVRALHAETVLVSSYEATVSGLIPLYSVDSKMTARDPCSVVYQFKRSRKVSRHLSRFKLRAFCVAVSKITCPFHSMRTYGVEQA